MWICLLVGGICFLIVYILMVMGLYTIAKREGLKNKWMLFVPVLNTYYLGVCAKNKIYNISPKVFAAASAVAEGLLVVSYILYYVAIFAVWDYIDWQPQYFPDSSQVLYYEVVGFKDGFPQSMEWLGWIYLYFDTFVIMPINLVVIVLRAFVLSSFFKTYYARHYFLFTLCALLFPITGILVYAVRNNKGMNFTDFLRAERERSYRMYQQQYGNPYQNPYGGYNGQDGQGYGPGYGGPGYGGQGYGGTPPDPFDEYGNSTAGDGSPFDDSGSSQGTSSSGSQNSGGGSSQGSGSSQGGSPFDEFN